MRPAAACAASAILAGVGVLTLNSLVCRRATVNSLVCVAETCDNPPMRWTTPLFICLLLAACGGGEDTQPQADTNAIEPEEAPGFDLVPGTPGVGDLLPQPMEVIWQPWFGDYDAMAERRIVRAVVPFGGFQFFYDGGMPRGAVYEQLQRFEAHINEQLGRENVRVYVVVIPLSRDQLIPALIGGNADIVAADLTVTSLRDHTIDFSRPVLKDVREVIVTGPSAPLVETLDDLAGTEIYVRASSSYFEHLQALSEDFLRRGLEPPEIRLADELLEAEDILDMLDAGVAGITVLDDHKASYWAGVFPNISVREDLVINENGEIAWAVRKESPELLAAINGFMRKFGRGTLVGNDTYNRYLADASRARCSGSARSTAEAAELAGYFRDSAREHGFDWLMLVAQGLQESGLRHNRRSSAGARGIMQIKPSTAADKNVGIADITGVQENIRAAAKYMRFLGDRYFSSESMSELNRWLFSLAAYNAGPAKINRYRQEARSQGYDPDTWFNNVEIIAARRIGRETVSYVSNIFKYYTAYKLVAERNQVFEERFGTLLTACAE